MFCRYRKILHDDKGFTLLEVMVAITILLLVILPLASLYVRSLTVIQNAALYSQAIQLAQERMDICQAVEYGSLEYYNEIYTPGFPYHGPLPPTHSFNGAGIPMVSCSGVAYDNRDNPDTNIHEYYYDPTDSFDDNYPAPVYRDYYNNYTGRLLDLNFNGLCDDDLDGDGDAGILGLGGFDMDDIEIATNGTYRMYSDDEFSGTPAAALGNTYVPGDWLWDTVVEGNYVSSMDPMYRQVRIQESQTPILDVGLLLDNAHTIAVSDFRHREHTFKNFVRMTTFIDPTPRLARPNDVDTWVDQLYIRDRIADGYTDLEISKLHLCLRRDLPLYSGFSTFDVGTARSGLDAWDMYNVNYKPPIYGIRVIVTVFYLTGEGEMQLTDIDNDGQVEEVPMETYGGARRISLERTFYNDITISGRLNNVPPPRRFNPGTEGANDSNPVRGLTVPDFDDSDLEGSDPCDLNNNGLPYYVDP